MASLFSLPFGLGGGGVGSSAGATATSLSASSTALLSKSTVKTSAAASTDAATAPIKSIGGSASSTQQQQFLTPTPSAGTTTSAAPATASTKESVGLPVAAETSSTIGSTSAASTSPVPTTFQTNVRSGTMKLDKTLDTASLTSLLLAPEESTTLIATTVDPTGILMAPSDTMMSFTTTPTALRQSTLSATPSAQGQALGTTQQNGIPQAATIAIGVAGGVGGLALIAAIALLCRRQFRKRKESNDMVLAKLDSMYEAGKPTGANEKNEKWNRGLESHHNATPARRLDGTSNIHPYAY